MKKLYYVIVSLFMLFSLSACSATSISSLTEELSSSSTNAESLASSSTKKLSSLKVHYIDVGQGDAELLQCNGINILIDTGESDQAENLISYLERYGVEKIDYLFLTHPHTDHMGGAVKIMNHFPVETVYLTNRTHTTVSYRKMIETIKQKKIKRVQAKAGVSISFTKNLKGTIVAPNQDYEDINASSIVMKVTYGKNSFLFTGDATVETEEDILSDGYDISSDVYKVSHHGSVTSNSSVFLNAIDPSISVIEVGKNNSYGHPHKEIRERLSQMNTKVYRTDINGSIIVTSNGSKLTVETEKGSADTGSSSSSLSNTTSSSSTISNAKATYIGNINSKVYHRTSCSSLPDKKNQITFSSKNEAKKAGYHACSRCNP